MCWLVNVILHIFAGFILIIHLDNRMRAIQNKVLINWLTLIQNVAIGHSWKTLQAKVYYKR